jgi:hypothetical protein
MYEIYLKHPVHGTKIAYMIAEAEQDEKNGWERYVPESVKAAEPRPLGVRGKPKITSEERSKIIREAIARKKAAKAAAEQVVQDIPTFVQVQQ